MSVLKKYFNKKVKQFSPVQVDYKRVVSYDEDGNEFVTWEPVDNAAIIASNGKAKDWQLSNLLKAGVNPDFGIRTGFNTRLEGIDTIKGVEADLDAFLKTDEAKSEE